MEAKQHLAYLSFFILLFNFSYSQLSNKHWLPPLHGNEDSSPNLVLDHYVYLSTPSTVPFPVTVTNGAGVPIAGSPFTISQGNSVRILIGNEQPSVMFLDRLDVGVKKSDKGLILQGARDFYVSLRVRASAHAEFLSSKGRTGAGTVFRLGSLPQDFGGSIRNFVSSFMATEDNTTVTLSDYDTNINFIVGNTDVVLPATQTFTLNAGESVIISGNSDNAGANLSGFVGALLVATKPIVVNTGNIAAGVLDSFSGQDFLLDQIVPFDQVDTKYVIMRGNGTDDIEVPLVVAHLDNTQIFINGSPTPIATINAGDYYAISSSNFQGAGSNQNMYIETSNPAFLYQVVAGSPNPATNGFYFIPPLSCFWQKSVDLIPSFNEIGPGNIYTESAIIIATNTGSVVTVNNVVTTVAPVPVLGNPNWVTYRISGLSGDVKVESTNPVAVGVFGASGNAGFGGYFSGFGSEPEDTNVLACTYATKDLFEAITGNPEPGGTWSVPAGGAPLGGPEGNTFDPNINIEGIYIYTFSINCEGSFLPVNINVDVTIVPGINAGISGNLPNVCINDTQFDLFNNLGPNVTVGGNWTFNGSPRPDGIFNPSTDLSGNYTYTVPSSGPCDEVAATIAVTVNQNPVATVMTNYEECDNTIDGDDTNGFITFNLNSKSVEAINSQPNLVATYHETITLANSGMSPLPSSYYSNTKTIYIRLTNSLTNCYSVTPLELVVNAKPVSLAEVSLKQCDDDTDAITDFNLTEANLIISTDIDLIFTYHTSQLGATNNTGIITNDTNYNASNGSVVWARIVTNKGCFRTARVNLIVSTTQIPPSFNPAPLEECDDYVDALNTDIDGIDDFNIEAAFTDLIKNQFPVGQRPFLIVRYFLSYNDALLVVNPITNPTNYRSVVPNNQQIFARVDSQLNTDTGCQGIKELELIVNPLPDVDLGLDFTLCVDPISGVGSNIVDATPVTSGSYSYEWTPTNPNVDALGNELPQFNITAAGTYSVKVTNTLTNCERIDTIDADFSSEPVNFIAEVTTPAFSSGLTTIVALATGGFGQYEYSLDSFVWQDSPIFTELPNGIYTVYVRDIQGCGILFVDNLFAITYPNFFTPNNDGYNDTWNIFGLDQTYNAKIFIFDRYGKLLKQIDPSGDGWNGTLNGTQLPASDYWFRIEYTEKGVAKEFRSHFSLKR